MGLTLYAAPAHAVMIPDMECRTYYEGEQVPKPVAALLKEAEPYKGWSGHDIPKNGKTALTLCRSKVTNTARYILQMPVQRNAGVCHFVADDVSRFFSKNGDYLGADHPRKDLSLSSYNSQLLARAGRMMFVADRDCPRQDDRRYVGTTNISPGVFRSLYEGYKLMTASEANFTQAVRLRPSDEFQAEVFRDFKLALKGRYGNAPSPEAVRLDTDILAQSSVYGLSVSAPGGGHGWILYMELDRDGWKLVNITSWTV